MTRAYEAGTTEPISMTEAVGYAKINCDHQATIDEALVAKHNRLFLLVDQHGDICPPDNCGLGPFHDDTRILSHYALKFWGGRGSLLSSRSTEMFSLQVDLAITDREFCMRRGSGPVTKNSSASCAALSFPDATS
jgi:hypothetical protein